MKRVVWLVGALLAVSRAASAQDEVAFLERARAATEKYRDQAAAVLDGYRRIGSDFPAMGEHWIRINLLFDGKIDAERPELLTYIPDSGKPRLLGVVYAVPLLPGESSPDFPAGRNAWHDHFRTLEDETVLPHHHFSGSAGDEARWRCCMHGSGLRIPTGSSRPTTGQSRISVSASSLRLMRPVQRRSHCPF